MEKPYKKYRGGEKPRSQEQHTEPVEGLFIGRNAVIELLKSGREELPGA